MRPMKRIAVYVKVTKIYCAEIEVEGSANERVIDEATVARYFTNPSIFKSIEAETEIYAKGFIELDRCPYCFSVKSEFDGDHPAYYICGRCGHKWTQEIPEDKP